MKKGEAESKLFSYISLLESLSISDSTRLTYKVNCSKRLRPRVERAKFEIASRKARFRRRLSEKCQKENLNTG